jgi:putative CocE/NonD family hydrolase
MHKKAFWTVALTLLFVLASIPATETVYSQGGRPAVTPEQLDKRRAIENELQSIATVERKLMIPMRDGVKIATDVYRPKDTSKQYPTIFVRTPYNFNFWDIRNSAPRDLSSELEAVKRGYAFVEMNERGRFFSEGNYDILGPPLTDGVDEFNWIAKQSWSNGKVGTIGCSSTAEWQLAVAAQGNPAYTTMIPQGLGAGVGRVAPYFEQGNWYRGGAVQMLFIAWLYGQQNQVRPMFEPNSSQEDLVRASKAFDLAANLPIVDWATALRHLPE